MTTATQIQNLTLGFALLISCIDAAQAQHETQQRPNFLFLLTDNQRWDALGCYGNAIVQTPNMDRLAASGTRFTNAFCTTSICAASRVSILNGQYRHRHGYTFQRPYLTTHAMRDSYPRLLKDAGYRTGFVGKLGLNFRPHVLADMFDYLRLNTANSRRDPYYRLMPGGELKHLTRLNGDHAIEFLSGCTEDQPFCLSVSFSAPHPEDDHPEQYIYDRQLEHLYSQVTIPPPNPRFNDFESLPEFMQVSMNRTRWFRRFDTPEKYQRMMKGMYRLITGVDQQVGRLMDTLEQRGLADNTIVIVTSDNGIMTGEHGLTGIWLMYEPSIRLPLIIFDPRIAAGTTSNEIALNIDFAPTMLQMAGLPVPTTMQGRSLVPLLDNSADDWRQDFYYEHYFRPQSLPGDEGNIPRSEGVRTRQWKYVRFFDEEPVYEQLFHLVADPAEVNNLAGEQRFAAQLESLRERTIALRRDVRRFDLAAVHRAADFSKLALPAAEPVAELDPPEQKSGDKDGHTESANTDGRTPEAKSPAPADWPVFTELEENELRVAFLGSGLIERAAEYGFLETELTRFWPQTDIVFRNLGWSGDTVQGTARVEFGPREKQRQAWQRPGGTVGDYGYHKLLRQLYEAEPDVLFIAYGSNVAFDGEAGLIRFRQGLQRLLRELEPTEVRIVLIAPPPREVERIPEAQLAEQNTWLQQVARHLQEVSRDRGHLLVDLFHAWPQLPARTSPGLTDNGIHLNAAGYQTLARLVAEQLGLAEQPWMLAAGGDGSVTSVTGATVTAIDQTATGLRLLLTDERLPSACAAVPSGTPRLVQFTGLPAGRYVLDVDGRRVARGSAAAWARGIHLTAGPEFEQVRQLREAILAKNRLYFFGFRPQNKAYIQLFRRHERGHHAAEMRQFTRLAREREQQIARLRVPRARYYELSREAEYAEQEVPTLAGQPNVELELTSFTVAPELQVNLFAADPLVANPINVNWDERGRLWVATSTTYPHLQPGQTPQDRILILEDIDRDGRADKQTVFADGLLVPHSVIPARGGAFVTQSTELLFLRDTDGDDRADERQVVLTGFGNADVHHMIHGLRWGPAGDLYFNQSIYINSTVETPWGVRQINGSCTWKLRPDTLRLEPYSRGLVNPWGFAFDEWGQSFATDGAGGDGIAYVFPGSAHTTHGAFERSLESLNPGRPKECGLEIVSGRHLPAAWHGQLLTCDFRANRVTRYRLSAAGSGYRSEFLGDVLASQQRAFRPVDVKLGPDGALYVVDWYNEIIDHGEVDFHHPLRDRRHGRIWRLTAKQRPLVDGPNLATATVRQLCEALSLPENNLRGQARRLLRERKADEVLPVCRQWLTELDSSDPNLDRHRLEALWVHQGLRAVSIELLQQTLASPDPRVRAAAVRVLGQWQSQLPAPLEWLSHGIRDAHPQVRLEAVHVLRQFGSAAALDLAMEILNQPLDNQLDFALWLTVRELQPVWLARLQAGEVVFGGDPQKIAFALAAIQQTAALGPLAELVRAGRLGGRQRQAALQTLASWGAVTAHELVIEEAARATPAEALVLLTALAQARRTRETPSNANRITVWLNDQQPEIRRLAAELAGRWRVTAAWNSLAELARRTEVSPDERLAAANALLEIDRPRGLAILKSLAATDSPLALRLTAVAAWAAVETAAAAEAAANVLVELDETDDPAPLYNALLAQPAGPRLLAAALARHSRMASTVAAVGVELANQSGRDLGRLVGVLRRVGQLAPLPARPSLAELIRDIETAGDPRRGEAIYRRADLQCTKCHAIGGAGGQVGPDLASLGGSAQIAAIVQSLLEPSAKIKEGYASVSLLHADGKIYSGRIHQRTADWVVLRNADNRLIRLAADEIEESRSSPLSLMPVGLAGKLSRGELVDLVRFLAALGKEEGFRVPAKRYVRRWQVLDAGAGAVPRDRAGRVLTAHPTLNWTPRFSTVAGELPLADVPQLSAGDGLISFIRFYIESPDAATVQLFTPDVSGLVIWMDGRPVETRPRTPLTVAAGETMVTLRVDRAKRNSPIKLEVQR